MKKKKPEISVIVCVYNTEKLLQRCLDSILQQSMADFEVLVVDDGSTDGSGDICDCYALRDNRIRVFHQTNQGIAAARQTGIDNMKGRFSIHVDPDDWIEPDMLETLYLTAVESGADVTVCGIYFDYADYTYILPQNFNGHGKDMLIEMIFSNSFFPSLCNKLIKSDFFSRYGIKMPVPLSLGEDMIVCIQFVLYGCSVKYIDKIFYHYDKKSNSQSLTTNVGSSKYFKEFCQIYPVLMATFSKLNGTRVLNRLGTMTAHKTFYYADISAKEGIRLFFRHIPMFIHNDEPLHRKINLILSAIGLTPIVKPIYKKLKKWIWK